MISDVATYDNCHFAIAVFVYSCRRCCARIHCYSDTHTSHSTNHYLYHFIWHTTTYTLAASWCVDNFRKSYLSGNIKDIRLEITASAPKLESPNGEWNSSSNKKKKNGKKITKKINRIRISVVAYVGVLCCKWHFLVAMMLSMMLANR